MQVRGADVYYMERLALDAGVALFVQQFLRSDHKRAALQLPGAPAFALIHRAEAAAVIIKSIFHVAALPLAYDLVFSDGGGIDPFIRGLGKGMAARKHHQQAYKRERAQKDKFHNQWCF